MERVSVAVSTAEGIERREFTSRSKAGAIDKIIRERYGLRNGSLSQDQLTFTEDETLIAGDYVFDNGFKASQCKEIIRTTLFILRLQYNRSLLAREVHFVAQ